MKTRFRLTSIPLLILVAVLTYLPLIHKIGYNHDDWYLMYIAGAYGPGSFWQIFSVDRPWRALVMVPAYLLFGADPLYYGLSAFVFRLIAALALLRVLQMLWPRQKTFTTMAALLFVIYPGFLSQINPIDYQSHIVGLAAALLSIACTLQAVLSDKRWMKVLFHGLSLPLGWLYLGQMEWYIGFEFLRWLVVLVWFSRENGSYVQKGIRTLLAAFPSLLVPGVFLFWRIFLFHSERGATDVDLQFEQVKLYPIQTVYHWIVQVIQDLFDVLLNAWTIPLSQLLPYVQAWGVFIALVSIALALVFSLKQHEDNAQNGSSHDPFFAELFWLGLLSAAAGLLPIAMVNREVVYPSYSRYTLVSSVGGALLIVAVLSRIRGRVLRNGILAGLIFIGVLTHHANSVKAAQETTIVQNFWWQVSWRAPQLAPRTTIIGAYPLGGVEEDYFLWGPANLIYYPEAPTQDGMGTALYAAVLNRDTVVKVLSRERQEFDNRKNIITYKNYRNILVLTQPTLDSCVHVINGLQPEFSSRDSDSIRVIGPYSEIEHILVDETPRTPPTLVFGLEPDHGWCYYYQKADLARQRGDWDAVLSVGEEAFAGGLTPGDSIEWIPFLQAYARAGDLERLKEIAPLVTSNPYISQQACEIIGTMPDVPANALETVNTLYCPE